MRLARITFGAPPGGPAQPVTAALVIDLMWATARPQDGVEHIAARLLDGGVEVGVFVAAPDAQRAAHTAACLARRALDRSAALAGWSADVVRTD